MGLPTTELEGDGTSVACPSLSGRRLTIASRARGRGFPEQKALSTAWGTGRAGRDDTPDIGNSPSNSTCNLGGQYRLY
jgi:hypothetical protein